MKTGEIRRVGLKDEVIRLHFANPKATVLDIAKALDARPEYVRSTFRRNDLTAPRGYGRKGSVFIETTRSLYSEATAARLQPEADRRGISIDRLIYMVLQRVASDRMVNAILDDMEDAA